MSIYSDYGENKENYKYLTTCGDVQYRIKFQVFPQTTPWGGDDR